VDNSVAVFGGALAYTRPGFGRKSGMEVIHGFKSLRFLLTNSKVPRDTKSLVAGVGEKKSREPELINKILEQIQAISDEARRALADPELSRESLLSALASLIEENHTLLVSLGVSHASLEAIKAVTAASPYGLSTKLTGAGGGGCAVTLVPDDFKETTLQNLTTDLLREGFEPYLTSVGGSGLGILSPYGRQHHRRDHTPPAVIPGQVTPPEMPDVPAQDIASEEIHDVYPDLVSHSLRSSFETRNDSELASWAEGRGRWLFV